MANALMEKEALFKRLVDEYADLMRDENGIDYKVVPCVPTVLRNSKTRLRDAEHMRKLMDLADKKCERDINRMKSELDSGLNASTSRLSLHSESSNRKVMRESSNVSSSISLEHTMTPSDRLQMLNFQIQSLERKEEAEIVNTHVLRQMTKNLISLQGAQGMAALRKAINNLDAALVKAESIRAKIQGQGSRIAYEVNLKHAEFDKEREEHDRLIQQSKVTSAKLNVALKRREKRILGRTMGKEERDALLQGITDSKVKASLLYLNLDVGRKHFLSGVIKLLHEYSTDSLEDVFERYEITLRDNDAIKAEILEKQAHMERLSRALQHKLRSEVGADTRITKGRRAVDQMEERVASFQRQLVETMEKERNLSKILSNAVNSIVTLKNRLRCVQLTKDDHAQIEAFHDLHSSNQNKEKSSATEDIPVMEGDGEFPLDDLRSDAESVVQRAIPTPVASETLRELQIRILLHDLLIIVQRLQTPGCILTSVRMPPSSRQPSTSLDSPSSSDRNDTHEEADGVIVEPSAGPDLNVEVASSAPAAGIRNFRNIFNLVKKNATPASSVAPSIGGSKISPLIQPHDQQSQGRIVGQGPTNPFNARVFPSIQPRSQAEELSEDDDSMSEPALESEFLAQSRMAHKKSVRDIQQMHSKNEGWLPKI